MATYIVERGPSYRSCSGCRYFSLRQNIWQPLAKVHRTSSPLSCNYCVTPSHFLLRARATFACSARTSPKMGRGCEKYSRPDGLLIFLQKRPAGRADFLYRLNNRGKLLEVKWPEKCAQGILELCTGNFYFSKYFLEGRLYIE